MFIDCVNSRNRSSTKLSAQYFGILECKLSGPEVLLDFKDVNDTKTSDSVKVMSDNRLAIIILLEKISVVQQRSLVNTD